MNTFKRDITSKLMEWKDSPFRKPLIIRGARQVGKTTVINQFSEVFENYIYVNLEDPMLSALFRQAANVEDLVMTLFAAKGLIRKEGSTLLFIDEIQNSAEAMAKLRYFYEEMPQLHVVAAGSLLEKYADKNFSFPVGRVEYLAMRPCSFREFLVAMDETILRDFIENNPEKSVPLHSKLNDLFLKYSIIGGMPEIVRAFTMTKDIARLDALYGSLLSGYKDDSEKYATTKSQKEVIRHILNSGWSKAGETIKFVHFADSDYRSREVSEAFGLLEKALLLELVYPTTSTQLPALPDKKKSPKLLWFDSGLVNYAAGIQREVLFSKDILDIWKGRFGEQIAGQELLSLSYQIENHRMFWTRNKAGSTAEVDFLLNYNSTLVPVEVKTGHNAHLKSLHSYIDLSQDCTLAIRIWSEPYSVDKVSTPSGREFTLLNIPFYLIGFLPNILKRNEFHGELRR